MNRLPYTYNPHSHTRTLEYTGTVHLQQIEVKQVLSEGV